MDTSAARKMMLLAHIIAVLIPIVAITNLSKLTDNDSVFFVVPMLMAFACMILGGIAIYRYGKLSDLGAGDKIIKFFGIIFYGVPIVCMMIALVIFGGGKLIVIYVETW